MKEASSEYKFETATYYRNLITNFKYIKNTLFNFKEIFNKHIILKLNIESGYKLFYVTKGEIINMEKYDILDNGKIANFAINSKALITINIKYTNEKKNMDFRNILYSEIKTLPEEMVIYLD